MPSALVLAESVGDVVQAVRIRANLAAAQEREAKYADALDTLRPAVVIAERAGHRSLLAMALSNQAGLLHRLGQLADAAQGYERSITLYQQLSSRLVAYPLNGLGDVHRQCGQFGEARTAYEQAIRAGTEDTNRQSRVPALAGLARVVAEDDPGAAMSLADEALARASGSVRGGRAAGGGSCRAGRRGSDQRTERSLAAAESARQHRALVWLAEALELRAAAAGTARVPAGVAGGVGDLAGRRRGAGRGPGSRRVGNGRWCPRGGTGRRPAGRGPAHRGRGHRHRAAAGPLAAASGGDPDVRPVRRRGGRCGRAGAGLAVPQRPATWSGS